MGGRYDAAAARDKRYYEWDHTHGDIEVFDKNGDHLGSMHGKTKRMIKPAVVGRSIDVS